MNTELNAPFIVKDVVMKMACGALCGSVVLFVVAEIAIHTGLYEQYAPAVVEWLCHHNRQEKWHQERP